MLRASLFLTILIACAGCADEACFRWPPSGVSMKEACPTRDQASQFFPKCAVATVDGDPAFDTSQQACCYPVTKVKQNDPSCQGTQPQ